MPPNVHFDHSSTYWNTGLAPSGPFKVDQSTAITISLLNDGDEDGVADVHLFFCGPTAGSPPGTQMNLVPLLDPPYNTSDPVISVGAVGSSTPGGQTTVSWTPSSSDPTNGFPNTLGASVHGCLFAQAGIQAIVPDYPGDTSALGNWDPTYPLCAQHNIDIITISPPPPAPKPLHYAFGAGHGLPKLVAAQLRVEKIASNDPGFVAYLEPLRTALGAPKTGRVLMAADAGVTAGVERIWVPKIRNQAAVLRLGHTGELPQAMASKLAAGRRAKSLKLNLDAGELRQAIVDITPPKGAKRGDFFAVGIVNEVAPASSAPSARAKPARVLGTLTLIVHIA